MAHPKQKLSKARTGKRRSANNVIESSAVNTCKVCGEVKRAHFACPKCGTYDEKRSVKVKTSENKESK